MSGGTEGDGTAGGRRRRPPPAWVILLGGVLFLVAAWVRHVSDSARGWEGAAVIGVFVLVLGVIVAARRRSLTSRHEP